MTHPVLHRLPLAQSVPNEVLARIFRYATYDTPGQAFGPTSSSWYTSEAAWSLPLVCRAWHAEGERALMRAPLLMSAAAAKGFGDTVEARPEWAAWVRDVVVGIGDDEEEGLEGEVGEEEASRLMVRAIERCGRLERIVIRPLHCSVRDRTFDALRGKPLKVLVFGPPLSAFADSLGWNKALLHPSDDFLSPSLEYLEVNAWVNGVVESETSSPPPSKPIPAHPLATPFPTGVARNLQTIKLHFDLDSPTLSLLLSRCPNLEILDLYTERRYTAHSTVQDALFAIAPSLTTLFWISNSPSEDDFAPPPPPPHPIFDSRLLTRLTSLTAFQTSFEDIDPNILRLLPPKLETLELHSFDEPGVFGGVELLLDALLDPSVEFYKFRRLVVHDVLSWWGQQNVDIVTKACKDRHIDFVFYHDIEY